MYRFLIRQVFYTALLVAMVFLPSGLKAQANFEMPSLVIRSGESPSVRIPNQVISSTLSSAPVQSLSIEINLKPAFLYPVRKTGETFWGIAASGLYKKESLNGNWTRVSVDDREPRKFRFEKSPEGELRLSAVSGNYLLTEESATPIVSEKSGIRIAETIKPAKKPGKKKLASIQKKILESDAALSVINESDKQIIAVEVTKTSTVVETVNGWVFEYVNSRLGLVLSAAWRSESGAEPVNIYNIEEDVLTVSGCLPVKIKESAKSVNRHEKGNWSEYLMVVVSDGMVQSGASGFWSATIGHLYDEVPMIPSACLLPVPAYQSFSLTNNFKVVS